MADTDIEVSRKAANFHVSLPVDLKDWLDRARGLVPRSAYIAAILSALRDDTNGKGRQ